MSDTPNTLADTLKADALAIFCADGDAPKSARDVIEWFDASLRVATDAGAAPTPEPKTTTICQQCGNPAQRINGLFPSCACGSKSFTVQWAAPAPEPQPDCTCPSGDGSLRWPCPQHPPAQPAAQAVAPDEVRFSGIDDTPPCMRVREVLEAAGVRITDGRLIAAVVAAAAPVAPKSATPDEVTEVLRKAINALPRYSFLMLGEPPGVRRVPDRSGAWIEWQAAHELFDAEVVDHLLAKAKKGEPG